MSLLADIRLVTYAGPSGSQPHAGVVQDGVVYDLQSVPGDGAPCTMLAALEDWDDVHRGLSTARLDGGGVGATGEVQLLAPILYPRAVLRRGEYPTMCPRWRAC